ncbi:hypothetical protein STEG23_009869 [Scotinomys teguina]
MGTHYRLALGALERALLRLIERSSSTERRGHEGLFVFFHRMAKPLFGSLSIVSILWMLLHRDQMETCWSLMGNPQLLMPESINSPVWTATVSTSTAAIQIDILKENIYPWLVADFQSNATKASAIKLQNIWGPID